MSWSEFIAWVDSLSAREASILGFLASTALFALGKYVGLPASRWVFRQLARLLYPVLSGTVVINRLWALPRYRKSLERSVSTLKNPWLEEGQKLTEIFVPVSISSRGHEGDRTDLRQVFEMYNTVVFVGEPGSGKTTALKSIALDCLAGRLRSKTQKTLTPVFIEIRRLAQSKKTIDQFINDVFEENQFPRAQSLVNRLRRSGKLVFLFDGLDEAGEGERQHVVEMIQTFLKRERRQRGCRVYVSSRPVGYDDEFRDVIDETADMANFRPADIRTFIRNWDFKPPKSHDRLIQAILERPDLLDICKNPLMLTIVTSLYKETHYELPDSREEFYKVCIDALIRRWDAAKNLADRNAFPPGLKQAFLLSLSFEALERNQLDFTERTLLDKVEQFVADRKMRDKVDCHEFMQELIRSGLLSRLPTGEIVFAHRTFPEYLASIHARSRFADLLQNWESTPDNWLEVCALFVADPSTQGADVAALLGKARLREDWARLVTLAGEAHNCPKEYVELILGELLPSAPEVWEQLDRRAISAIAQLGTEAREQLEQLLEHGSQSVRRNVVHSLGLLGDQWAMSVLDSALKKPDTQPWAVEAIAGIGDVAIPYLRDLVESKTSDEALLSAALMALQAIGSPLAVEVSSQLLAAGDATVRTNAALTIAHILSDPDIRSELESSSMSANAPELAPAESAWELSGFADLSTRAKVIYSQMIRIFAQFLTHASIDEEQQVQAHLKIETLPSELLIPTMIRAYGAGVRYDPDYRSLRISHCYQFLNQMSTDVAKAHWRRVRASERPRIALEGLPLIAFYLICSTVMAVPLVSAIYNQYMSPWWLTSILVLFAAPILISIDDKNPGLVLKLAGSMFSCPLIVAREFLPGAGTLFVILGVPSLANLAVLAIAAWTCGWWHFLYLTPAVVSLLFTWQGEDELEIVKSRVNPFVSLSRMLGEEPRDDSSRRERILEMYHLHDMRHGR